MKILKQEKERKIRYIAKIRYVANSQVKKKFIFIFIYLFIIIIFNVSQKKISLKKLFF